MYNDALANDLMGTNHNAEDRCIILNRWKEDVKAPDFTERARKAIETCEMPIHNKRIGEYAREIAEMHEPFFHEYLSSSA